TVAPVEAGAETEEVHLEQLGVRVTAQLVETDEELLAREQVVVVVHLERLPPPPLPPPAPRGPHSLRHPRHHGALREPVGEGRPRGPRSARTTKRRASTSGSASTRWNAKVAASLIRVQRRSV